MVTRRDMIGLAAAGLAGTALESQGAITRSAIALRGAMMSANKGDDEMWKEIFLGIADGSYAGKITFPAGFMTSRNFFFTSCPNVTELEFLGETVQFPAAFIYSGMSGLRTIRFSDRTSVSFNQQFNFTNITWPLDIYIPKVRSLSTTNPLFRSVGHNNYHIDLPCEQIKAIPNFPGSTAGNLDKISFIGTDGRLDYNSGTGNWDFTSN